jgi:hypothetical protein
MSSNGMVRGTHPLMIGDFFTNLLQGKQLTIFFAIQTLGKVSGLSTDIDDRSVLEGVRKSS